MPDLVDPDVRYQWSFLAAASEIRERGEDERYAGLTIIGQTDDFKGEHFPLADLWDPQVFAAYCRQAARPRRPGHLVARGHRRVDVPLVGRR